MKKEMFLMKNKYTIGGIILTAAGLAFIGYALANPQLSFPWSNTVTYILYAYYIVYTVLVFCMPKLKNVNSASCITLAFQFIALGLITISIGMPYSVNRRNNWYLSTGLCISALAQFANVYFFRRQEKKKQETEEETEE